MLYLGLAVFFELPFNVYSLLNVFTLKGTVVAASWHYCGMRIEVPENKSDRRVIGYTRVSTRAQEQETDALGNHIARLKKAGATEIFVDVASRSKSDREELTKVIDIMKASRCDELLFLRLDRITDSHALLADVISACLQSDIKVRGLDDNIDLTTVGGRLHANILVSLARAEVERLTERIRHGWAHVRAKRVAVNPPFGYCKEGDRHALDHTPYLCMLDDRNTLSKAQIGRGMVESFLKERSLRLALRAINEKYGIMATTYNNRPGKAKNGRVAMEIFRFSPSGLRLWLTNPVLRGHLVYKPRSKDREIIYNTHPGQVLMSESEFLEVSAIIEHNRQMRGGSHSVRFPCSGLVFCSECRGSHYSLSSKRGKTPGRNYYYQCKNWQARTCSQRKSIRMELIENAVIEALCDRASAIADEGSRPITATKPTKLLELEAELASVEGLIKQFGERRYGSLRNELLGQVREFQESMGAHQAKDEGLRELLEVSAADPEYWLSLTKHQQRQLFHALVDAVVILDGAVERVDLKI